MSAEIEVAATRVSRARHIEQPLVRLLTVEQAEANNPGVVGRLRGWLHRADAGDSNYTGLRRATVRIGRSVFIDECAFAEWLSASSGRRPAPSRRHTGAAKNSRRPAAVAKRAGHPSRSAATRGRS